MALIIEADLDALAVPAEGPVMFVLTLDDHDGRLVDQDVSIIQALRHLVEQVAPDRSPAVVIPHGMTLQALSETNLAAIGLTRTPPAP